MSETTLLHRDDPYSKTCEAIVIAHADNGIVLDKTNFYATSGGQPGDTGTLAVGGTTVDITNTVFGEDKATIIHVLPDEIAKPEIGAEVTLFLNWERRYAHMRMHTALHLLCSIIPHPVTGGSIGEAESRLDFDMPENADKLAVSEALMALIEADHDVSTRWIDDAELDANPDLVRTLSVQPPRGSGKIRLVAIGENGSVDLQPCGGTHVKTTAEIGPIHVGKVEKKGKMNRRLRVRFGPMPS